MDLPGRTQATPLPLEIRTARDKNKMQRTSGFEIIHEIEVEVHHLVSEDVFDTIRNWTEQQRKL